LGSGNNEVDGEINGSVVGNKVDCAIVVHSMEVPEEVLYRARLGHVHMDIVLYRVQRVKPRATVKSMVISMELLLVTKLMVTSTEVPEEVLYRARVGHVHMDTVL
jgi:hypothetical protein